MSRVFFISDLHLGCKNILNFSGHLRDGDTSLEHDHILVTRWNTTVSKRDKVYVLGDVCFDHDRLPLLEELKGTKVLIRGNHDDNLHASTWLKYFSDVQGITKYGKEFWLSHAPIHPAELRGKRNIHGHVHSNSIRDAYGELDNRYINVCVETNLGYPISLDQIRSGWYDRNRKC